MGRHAKPGYYPSRNAWFINLGGRQIRLAVGKDGKAEAWKAYHRLMLESPGKSAAKVDLTFEVLADMLLEEVKTSRAPLTFEWYRRHLQAAVLAFGSTRAAELEPRQVTRWLAGKSWGTSTRHGALTAIKRVYSWARKHRLVDVDPVKDIEKPGIESRHDIMTADQVKLVMESADGPFRDLLTILHETGMRPSEAYALSADHLTPDRGMAIFRRHKTSRKSSRPRVVQLTPVAAEILGRLAVKHPTGPLLLNQAGRPWTRNAVACRFRRIRERHGFGREATAESFRHAYVTDGLERGVSIATMAELVGHGSTAMIDRHYSHLADRAGHLRSAARSVRPATDET
jgi:site-specific recombinase XerD